MFTFHDTHSPRNTWRFAACAVLLAGVATASPVRYAEDRAPGIVNPLFTTTMGEARLNELVFDGLFSDDYELRSTPRMVVAHELSEDQLSMELRLRSDVTWHDGEPYTAHDVVFTIEAMRNPETASTEAARVSWITKAEATDDHTLQLTFDEPEYAPQDKLHFKILPRHLFTDTAVKRSDTFRTRPVGTGPYVLVGFNDDNSVQLQRNVNYHEDVTLNEIVMREVADKNYQSKLLLYESLEALVRVLPRDLATLQNDRKVELYPYQTNSWWYLGFNHKFERFQSPEIREAVALMVNKEELLAPIGTGEVLTGPFVKSSPFYNHSVEPSTPNEERARELLQAAGYTFDGRYFTKNGHPLTIRLATLSNLEVAQDVVINIQSQLQSQGVAVEPIFLGTAEWKQQVWRERDFDMILSQWSFDRNEDVYEQFHSGGSRNFVSYSNPEVDALLDAAAASADPQEKRKLLKDVHALISVDRPMVFLWTLDSYAAMRTSVANVMVHPFYFFTWARNWTMK